MFKSTHNRITFYFSMVSICVLVIGVYLIVFGLQSVSQGIKEKDLNSLSSSVATVLCENPDFTDLDTQEGRNRAEELLPRVEDGKLFLVNDSGDYIGYEGKENPYNFDFSGSTDFQKVYKNKKNYMASLTKLSGHEGWFVVYEETEEVAFPGLTDLESVIIAAVTTMLLLLWIGGKRMALAIEKPIRKLAFEAGRIAEGDISKTIEVNGQDEVSSIASSVNKILDTLKATMRQVLSSSGEAASMQEIMGYLEETYEDFPAGILSITAFGEISTFNDKAREITGIPAGEVIGINIKNPTPTALTNLIFPLRRCLEQGAIQLQTITDIKRSDGETISVTYSTNIQFGMDNEVLGAICVFRPIEDITRFRESINRVKHMESIGEMSANIAHEVKNPLSSIRGYAQYVKSMTGDENKEELDIIIHETDRLTEMLDRFLNFARPKLPDLTRENMNDVLEYVSLLVEKDLPDNIKIRKEFSPTPDVMADRAMLEPTILNIILNSVQALPNGGLIILKTYYDKKRTAVCTEIHDNGVGIPGELSDKIFDPFFTTKSNGTGLGLPIASRTVEAHRGILEVESIEGEMTKFKIILQAAGEKEDGKSGE